MFGAAEKLAEMQLQLAAEARPERASVLRAIARDYDDVDYDALKLAEVERMIVMCKHHFRKQIGAGRLTLEEANRRLDVLRAMARDYRSWKNGGVS
jgi:hypothetical protein